MTLRDGRARWDELATDRQSFVSLVRSRGADLYRDLPWRNVGDPYAVLVSEVMLQQTQVSRVLRYWPRWMSLFPTVDSLASSDTATVLEAWQGLGYNRRALALKRACEACSRDSGGRLPDDAEGLRRLPGIGPATAAGVVAFAHDKPAVYLETNVRSVFLHELFPDRDGVADREILPYVADSCPQADVRGWYYALLDYGAHLKARFPNPSRRSAHHARQSRFQGSRREKRSFVLKLVLAAQEGVTVGEAALELAAYERAAGRSAPEPDFVEGIVKELTDEGFFHRQGDLLVP